MFLRSALTKRVLHCTLLHTFANLPKAVQEQADIGSLSVAFTASTVVVIIVDAACRIEQLGIGWLEPSEDTALTTTALTHDLPPSCMPTSRWRPSLSNLQPRRTGYKPSP